jgi:hypothetical protein
MTKRKKTKQPGTDEFRRLTRIKDPVVALDTCRAEFKKTSRDYWTKKRTHLGVLTATSKRVCATKKSWRTFITKSFWLDPNLEGGIPTMEDRSNGLGFVIRYGMRAIKRGAYQRAWRNTVVAEHLLACGVKPIDFADYLGQRGQGIGKTYEKAQAEKKALMEKKASKGDGRAAAKGARSEKADKVTSQDRGPNNRTDQKGAIDGALHDVSVNADAPGRSNAKMRKGKFMGEHELIQPLFLLPIDSEMNIRVKAVLDERGRHAIKVVKLLHNVGTEQASSERRKSQSQDRKRTLRRFRPIRKVRRTAR